jgi:KaiC/GvpD/RAD55 family RecA-like ATPase
MMNGHNLSTGIREIDEKLGGGFKPGSLVALVTSPNTPSYAVLQELMRQRSTIYISTLRPASVVENDLPGGRGATTDVKLAEVGKASTENLMLHELTGSEIHAAKTTDPDRLFDEVYDLVQQVGERHNVIIDPTNPLERNSSRADYKQLLSRLASRMAAADSIGVFHCTTLGDPPAFRETTLTVADVVWELNTVSDKNGDLKVQTQLPKNRGGDALLERVDLVVSGSNVSTDKSRRI